MYRCLHCRAVIVQQTPYCPMCGQRMGTTLPSRDVAPSAPKRGYAGLLIVLLLAMAGFGWYGHVVTSARTCDQATADLANFHPVVFGAMDAAGVQVTAQCVGAGAINPFTAARNVEATWVYQGQPYAAIYEDSPAGALTPANPTATALDRAASSGTGAVRSLLGGL